MKMPLRHRSALGLAAFALAAGVACIYLLELDSNAHDGALVRSGPSSLEEAENIELGTLAVQEEELRELSSRDHQLDQDAVAASDELPLGWRSAEYGPYLNMNEVRADAQHVCHSFLPTKEAFAQEHLSWGGDKNGIPYSTLKSDAHELTGASLRIAKSVADSHDDEIRFAAESLHDSLSLSIQHYVDHELAMIPRNADWPPRSLPGEGAPNSRYGAAGVLHCGKWKAEVDFQSRDYAEVRDAFDALDEAVAARKQAVTKVLQ